MSIEELWEIKKRQGKEKEKMTFKELDEYYAKGRKVFLDKVGEDFYQPTDDPKIWRHIPKKK